MRRLVVTDFITLDGIIEAPGMEEHRAGRNGWALRLTDDELEDYNGEIFYSGDALLFGRRTYQIWAAFWPTVTEDSLFTKRMQVIPKYVVSSTLKSADWGNTTILSGDVHAEVEALKAQDGGDILCYGSTDLVATLMKHRLVDEYRLLLFPVILGSGKRLFREDIDLQYLQLATSRTFGSGVVLLSYLPSEETPSGPYLEQYSWTSEQVRSLLAAENVDRVLATVLFTDIVDSTGRAAALGDRAWRQLLDRHDQAARAEVARWHGRFVKNTGDGVLATFDAPTRALRCAFGLLEVLGGLDLRIRAALHCGEVEMREADVGGIGVHIASRALAEAADGKVVVTRTVRDLATGTDLAFSPLGSVRLRGVPGQWELFEASIG